MSFSYKTLSSNDITLTSYIANKQWEVTNTTLSQNGVAIYIGENLPVSRTYPFDPINDLQTSNKEYRRLIFDSIKHLFFENYTSGSLTGEFFNSSSYFNYEQNTLALGSGVSTFRRISTITGSKAPVLYDAYEYDNNATFDSDRGGKVVIVSIDQNIHGSGLNPNSVFISGSGYYLRDDGEGNLYNWRNEGNYAKYSGAIYNQDIYLELASSGLQLEYVGNVFYSHGLIVITDEDYLCVFGAPPSTVNDYFSYLNMEQVNYLDILGNDLCDCGILIPSTFETSSISGFTFPNFTYSNGIITIINDQESVIPGNYKLGYTIKNSSGLVSNTGSIDLSITSTPLQIENIINEFSCYGVETILPVTFSINYGVPYYSYSLDEGVTYTNVNNLFNVTVSGSMTSSLNNTIYVKDYLGDITTSSFSSWYPGMIFTSSIHKNPCISDGTDGQIIIITPEGAPSISASIDNNTYYGLNYLSPKIFTNLSTGSYTIYVKDINNCISSSVVTLVPYTPVTASVTITNISCYGDSTGNISIPVTNVIDILYVNLTDPTGSYIYSNKPLSEFPNNVVTASNLITGSYSINLFSIGMNECQNYSDTIIITGSSQVQFSATASYINSCSNEIIFNAVGGLGNYTYYAQNIDTLQTYSSTTSPLSLLDLNGILGGTYNIYVADTGSCISNLMEIEVYGREYIYLNSYCEQT